MTDKPEEKVEEPKQTTTKDAIKIMLKSLEQAYEATGYKEEGKETLVLFDDGRQQYKDPTFVHYIKIAERAFIKKHAHAILKDAVELLENELGEIREMLQ